MRGPTIAFLAVTGFVVAFGALTIPPWQEPVPSTQTGPDGTGMIQFASPSPWQVAPAPAQAEPKAAEGGPMATAVYKNVTVLTDVSAAEFMRLQTAMTAWVSPKQGCAFCHTGQDFSADTNPMKAATREMIRLTRALNTTWKGHVGETGVTCFSCHRGEPMPPETWFPSHPRPPRPMVAKSENWDEAADTVRKFFPDNGWALYLLNDEPIRGEPSAALRNRTAPSAVETKRVYEMMMQMSDGIGVNCTFCHATRDFSDWSQSTPARWTGFDALRMTRELNLNYLVGLHEWLPQSRELVDRNVMALPAAARGPRDGSGLAVCATCHYGRLKPDAGAATLANYPALGSAVNAAPTHPVAPAPRRAAQN